MRTRPIRHPLPAMLTTKRIIYGISILFFFGCQRQADKTSEINVTIKNRPSIKQYRQVDTSKVTLADSYYQFIRLTDSTSGIAWGNKTVSNADTSITDNFFFEMGRIGLKWSNEKFIALGRGSGSDTWFQIILPLTKNAELQYYENPLAVDEENGIIICEHTFDECDTVLIATNMLTGKRHPIGLDWKKCSSAINHYCIDSISISKKQLYVKWTLPNKIDEPNKTEIKRIKLNL